MISINTQSIVPQNSTTVNMNSSDASPRLGILAYGSLLSEPGTELDELLVGRIDDVETPFPVEFARACSCRDNAPTLAPVETGGAPVRGAILLAAPSVSEATLTDALWHRETRTERRDETTTPETKDLLIRRAEGLEAEHGLRRVFYAHLKANIDDRTAEHLAELAIESARSEAGGREEDGISYLMTVKENGLSTSLLVPYEQEILRKTGTASLTEARRTLVE